MQKIWFLMLLLKRIIIKCLILPVVHVFGKHLTSVTVGRALNRDQWHSVVVTIDVHGARLIAKVDQLKEEVYLKVSEIHNFNNSD